MKGYKMADQERRSQRATYEEAHACGIREHFFRSNLTDLVTTLHETLPPYLLGDVQDHLTRTDAQGYSLCFAGPLRERLMHDLKTWLIAHNPKHYEQVSNTLFADYP
jgi:hypothetical protein